MEERPEEKEAGAAREPVRREKERRGGGGGRWSEGRKRGQRKYTFVRGGLRASFRTHPRVLLLAEPEKAFR